MDKIVRVLLVAKLLYKSKCPSIRLSVGNATKGFATYGCFHPYLIMIMNLIPFHY